MLQEVVKGAETRTGNNKRLVYYSFNGGYNLATTESQRIKAYQC